MSGQSIKAKKRRVTICGIISEVLKGVFCTSLGSRGAFEIDDNGNLIDYVSPDDSNTINKCKKDANDTSSSAHYNKGES